MSQVSISSSKCSFRSQKRVGKKGNKPIRQHEKETRTYTYTSPLVCTTAVNAPETLSQGLAWEQSSPCCLAHATQQAQSSRIMLTPGAHGGYSAGQLQREGHCAHTRAQTATWEEQSHASYIMSKKVLRFYASTALTIMLHTCAQIMAKVFFSMLFDIFFLWILVIFHVDLFSLLSVSWRNLYRL